MARSTTHTRRPVVEPVPCGDRVVFRVVFFRVRSQVRQLRFLSPPSSSELRVRRVCVRFRAAPSRRACFGSEAKHDGNDPRSSSWGTGRRPTGEVAMGRERRYRWKGGTGSRSDGDVDEGRTGSRPGRDVDGDRDGRERGIDGRGGVARRRFPPDFAGFGSS